MTASTTTTASAHLQKVGLIVELCGAAALGVGVILSVHHYAIAACIVGGVAAFAVGWKLRN
jgi:hypothetical protein